MYGLYTSNAQSAQSYAGLVWCNFFKRPSDDAPRALHCETPIKDFIQKALWNEVYDLIEFSLSVLPPDTSDALAKRWNAVLERENSGYRIVKRQVVDITSPQEIREIEKALSAGIPAVQEHIKAALSCLSNRKDPNYRNAIKESISAVESVCRLLAGGKTLGEALKGLRGKIEIHPALEKGFTALYGYTSDKGGIRHALLEESSLDATDARFFLVACSAFVNFIVAKAAAANIKIG
jgi:hypothetical protein